MDESEFDKFADEYYELLARNIAASGETPDFFAEYKIRDVAIQLQREGCAPRTILDFGAGVGNSVPYFRKYFPRSALTCADVSQRSLDLCRRRYPGSLTVRSMWFFPPACSTTFHVKSTRIGSANSTALPRPAANYSSSSIIR